MNLKKAEVAEVIERHSLVNAKREDSGRISRKVEMSFVRNGSGGSQREHFTPEAHYKLVNGGYYEAMVKVEYQTDGDFYK